MSNTLTDTHKKKQLTELAKHNLSQADMLPNIDTSQSEDGVILSSNINESHHAPSGWVMAANVKELKEKLGVKDSDIDAGLVSDGHIKYPPAASNNLLELHSSSIDGCAFDQSLKDHHLEDAHHLSNATTAFVMGHSAKTQSYENSINKVSFPKPMTVPVFAVENVVVTKDKPLIIKGEDDKPVVVNFGSVTVEPGGQIIVLGGSTKWTSQTFIQQ